MVIPIPGSFLVTGDRVAMLVVALAVAAVCCLLARRRGRPIVATMIAAAGALGYLALTLSPSVSGSAFPGTYCLIRSPLGVLHALDAGTIANLLVTIPMGVGLALLGKSMRATATTAAALALAVEAIQGAVPALGRICDTQDALTNVAGAMVGWAAIKGMQALLPHHRPTQLAPSPDDG